MTRSTKILVVVTIFFTLLIGGLIQAPPASAATLRGCELMNVIKRAGYGQGNERVAWAVIMRESGGVVNMITNGADYGLLQVNVPTHPDADKARLLQARYNLRYGRSLLYKANWRPWGLHYDARTGTITRDYRDYAGIWSDSTKEAWIWRPFAYWYARVPRCA